MKRLKFIIVTPVFNDWTSFKTLITEIDRVLAGQEINLSILAVNDASTIEHDLDSKILDKLNIVSDIELLHLSCNLGHQRAIAIGLADIMHRQNFDAVIVMDSDGEDRPEDLIAMIDAFRNESDKIIIARRDKRSEGRLFQTGYIIYKFLFRILTGKVISFGNFCLIPAKLLKRLIYHDNLWNHLAATILRSGLPLKPVSTTRGVRYSGKAHMNLGSLILLGLSAVAVYSDVALLRTLSASLILSLFTLIGIIIVAVIRFITELAIPGWASDVVGSLAIILIQCLMVSVFILFIILANRSHRMFIPAKHYTDYIIELEVIS